MFMQFENSPRSRAVCVDLSINTNSNPEGFTLMERRKRRESSRRMRFNSTCL